MFFWNLVQVQVFLKNEKSLSLRIDGSMGKAEKRESYKVWWTQPSNYFISGENLASKGNEWLFADIFDSSGSLTHYLEMFPASLEQWNLTSFIFLHLFLNFLSLCSSSQSPHFLPQTFQNWHHSTFIYKSLQCHNLGETTWCIFLPFVIWMSSRSLGAKALNKLKLLLSPSALESRAYCWCQINSSSWQVNRLTVRPGSSLTGTQVERSHVSKYMV